MLAGSFDLDALVRANIRSLKPYRSARDEFDGTGEIFLDANENPYETGLNRYPDPLQRELKARIAALKGVQPEQIFLGNGSDEAIALLITIFCEPQKDHIMVLPPTYGMYQVSADIQNVGSVEVPLTADYQLDVEAVLQKADKNTKILFICHPNNPTGNNMRMEDIQRLLREFKGIVVVDEAYIDFSGEKSCATLLSQYPNLVVMQTFSKAWGLAGIRLGMAFAGENIIGYYNKVKPPYNVNILTQEAALKALDQQETAHGYIRKILEQRQWLAEQLGQLAVVQNIVRSDANFLLVQVTDANNIYKYLIEKNIIVRNRASVLLCEGCLRITVGTKEENQRLIEALKSYA